MGGTDVPAFYRYLEKKIWCVGELPAELCNALFSRRQKNLLFLPSKNKNKIINFDSLKITQRSEQPPQQKLNTHSLIPSTPPNPHPALTALATHNHVANADAGATGNYLSLADITCLRDIKVSTPHEQIKVQVANGKTELSSHHGYLDVPGAGAMLAYIFPNI